MIARAAASPVRGGFGLNRQVVAKFRVRIQSTKKTMRTTGTVGTAITVKKGSDYFDAVVVIRQEVAPTFDR